MTNNNWNTVNWDEIPEDVATVVTFEHDELSYYKVEGGILEVQGYRGDTFSYSKYGSIERVIKHLGDQFHLRTTPTTQPTPVTPESTQVGSSEVEATTTPEFDWSSVDEEVEAVLLVGVRIEQVFKEEGDKLLYKLSWVGRWFVSKYHSIKDREDRLNEHSNYRSARVLRRPPAPITPEAAGFEEVKGSTDLRLQCREAILSKKPSIHTILQEAQQSILKHHGVTGKVKFIVTCS